jgi:hypothetical protein
MTNGEVVTNVSSSDCYILLDTLTNVSSPATPPSSDHADQFSDYMEMLYPRVSIRHTATACDFKATLTCPCNNSAPRHIIAGASLLGGRRVQAEPLSQLRAPQCQRLLHHLIVWHYVPRLGLAWQARGRVSHSVRHAAAAVAPSGQPPSAHPAGATSCAIAQVSPLGSSGYLVQLHGVAQAAPA